VAEVYRIVINPKVADDELHALFNASWPNYEPTPFEPVLCRSLAYLGAYSNDLVIGFVNLAWDGGFHAFLLDTTVHPAFQRRGIGKQLVERATQVAREAGMGWLHVDYEPHLGGFYESCGFRPTTAGLLKLN